MSDWDFPGAKWWKFDFHTHTPASFDFRKKRLTPEDWLREFMKRGIDCVAVTDHNSGEWIDKLKSALERLEQEADESYRPLHLFPGVEISASGGVHMLAILDPAKKTADIDSLLGAVEFHGEKGKTDAETRKSVTEVIDAIGEIGGIAVPAHVDKEKGLFLSLEGQALEQVLRNPNVHAIELRDKDFAKPELYQSTRTDWTEVCGSDFHGDSTDVFTWVKMGKPSIEGLRLALIDGNASVIRDMDAVPNRHAECVIEEITVEEARYMGRPQPLVCRFSPFLNTIIGGRGSGKSTLLEFMRLALRREQELPDRLRDDYQSYFSTDEGGLLTQGSILCLVYRKGDTRYRLKWEADFNDFAFSSLEEQDEKSDWHDTEGEIVSLFPVSIYSQKQVFELASDPQGLLGIIDRESEVEFDAYRKAFGDCSNSCKQLYQHKIELSQRIGEEKALKGQLNDLARQIKQIEQVEKSGHKDALRNYRLRQRQLSEIEYFERRWMQYLDNLREKFAEEDMTSVDEDCFAQHPEILTALQEKHRQWQQVIDEIRGIVEKQVKNLEQWKANKQSQPWMKALDQDVQRYDQLRARLERQGIDPETYPRLLQERSRVKKELQSIATCRNNRDRLLERYWEKVSEAKRHREELTKRRTRFLDRVLRDNPSIRIKIKPFAEPWVGMEKSIRQILQVGDRFDKDIEALKQIIEKKGLEQAIERIIDICNNKQHAEDARFQNHLRGLPKESLIDLRLWFPQDVLKITYEGGQEISEGSPGQKSAVLLAFILSHGSEPLLLDQPEDDLDNDLIYSLIVQAIKTTKTKRQIIVVTHNANIVVNGDSEMVHCLNVACGQSHLRSDSLQSGDIRQRICNTMEGGKKAFEQRYKRIHLED